MNVWKKIQQFLENRQSLYLLIVVESIGSAPGRVGFKMLVADNGDLFGSIGGGVMEYNMVEKARDLLNQGLIQQHAIKQVHKGDAKASSGMICSGSQIIAFNFLNVNDLGLIQSINNSVLPIGFSHNGLTVLGKDVSSSFKHESFDKWSYAEKTDNIPMAHIFGAGHVSVPTAELLNKVGFDVSLYDNRININTFDDNDYANNKHVIEYEKIAQKVKIKASDYVLIMTHKFTEDLLILSQILNNKYKYVGVLGSDNKVRTLFKALKTKGFSQTQLSVIYAPIGIKIKSKTIEEIALSIVAQIVKIKNS